MPSATQGESLEGLDQRRMPIIQSLLKGWGPKVTSLYLYTYWVITIYL